MTKRQATAQRFWAKVDKAGPDDCWLWTASIVDGYGKFMLVHGHQCRAHRWAYEQLVGPIPEGLDLDHLCRVRHCVNPAHLEPVTRGENLRRSPLTLNGINARKTHCPRGHEYGPERNRHGRRVCRLCRNQQAAA